MTERHLIQCVSCKWWNTKMLAGDDEYRACMNPNLRAQGYEDATIYTSPIFACNQSEAK